MDRQLSSPAMANAVERLQWCAIAPTASDPTPIPVSNAQTKEPKVRARKRGSGLETRKLMNAGKAPPKPIPKRMAAPTSCHGARATASRANETGTQANDG